MKLVKTAVLFSGAMLACAANAATQNWSGPYVGVNAGLSVYSPTFHDPQYNHSGSEDGENDFNAEVGAQAGYNWQSSALVYGLEADIQYHNNTSDGQTNCTGNTSYYSSEAKWSGSVRGRVGVAVDQALVYLTAGPAWMRANHTYRDCSNYGTTTKDFFGVELGAGVDIALQRNMSARIEALYYQMSEEKMRHPQASETYGLEPSGTMVRAGLNWKF